MDKKLSIAMISGPQDDMRHTGHVGFDGTTFGDVAFIVDNYDKLPKKIQPGGESLSLVTFVVTPTNDWGEDCFLYWSPFLTLLPPLDT